MHVTYAEIGTISIDKSGSQVGPSQLIVHYNIARLAAAMGDEVIRNEHLKLARKGNHAVIEKRIAFDGNLAKATNAGAGL
jgi:hypothetical protein